jgi:tetratricopeptide (TPR) repeat protein
VELAGDQPEPWVALVSFLGTTGQPERAEAEMARAERQLSAEEGPLALAECREALGQREQAEKRYLAALVAQPEAPTVLGAVASFHARSGQFTKAEPILRKLLAMKSDVSPTLLARTRRDLALVLAITGDYRQSLEALRLMEQNLALNPGSPEDERARAAVLIVQPSRRREAIRALETSLRRARPTPREQFLLARLYEAERDWGKAHDLLESLLKTTNGDNPTFLAHFLLSLIREGALDEAAEWLPLLEKREPKELRTAEIKARLLLARKKPAEAAARLTEFARTHDKEADAQLAVAFLLDDMNLAPDEAEALYRAHVQARDAEQPECVLFLARHLARRGRLTEALDLCDRARARCRPATVGHISVAILRAGRPSETACRRVEGWLAAAVEKEGASVDLDLIRADLLDLTGRYAEAEELYRRALRQDDHNVIARNNLALFLALRASKGAEALALIQQTIELAGPMPELLDTRATVSLALRDGARAVKDLEDALALRPSATGQFRLARALLLVGDRRGAREALSSRP